MRLAYFRSTGGAWGKLEGEGKRSSKRCGVGQVLSLGGHGRQGRTWCGVISLPAPVSRGEQAGLFILHPCSVIS